MTREHKKKSHAITAFITLALVISSAKKHGGTYLDSHDFRHVISAASRQAGNANTGGKKARFSAGMRDHVMRHSGGIILDTPINIISLGAGVQSSTMALMAAHGEITPMPKCAIFADTQDEPQSVYTWLDWLEKQLPFPVHRVTQGKLSDWLTHPYFSRLNQRMTVGGLPAFVKQNGDQGHMSRQCTSNFKVIPIDKEITRQMRDSGVKRAIKWIGISLDEIVRMKPSRRSTVKHRWPLIDKRIKRHDCLLWMQKHGYPKPPRSACVYCPYHTNDEWRNLSDRSFLEASDFEKRLQETHRKIGATGVPFLHRSMVPLREVDFSTDEDHGQQVMFGNECEGMCGV